jgi:hypothetical protein
MLFIQVRRLPKASINIDRVPISSRTMSWAIVIVRAATSLSSGSSLRVSKTQDIYQKADVSRECYLGMIIGEVQKDTLGANSINLRTFSVLELWYVQDQDNTTLLTL